MKEKPTAEAYKNPFALKCKPKEEVHKVKDLVRLKDMQGRADADKTDEEKKTDNTFILERAEKFAEDMKNGDADKFPPIKCVRIVKSSPEEKNPHEGALLIFDGMNQHRARELAKVPEAKCLVWEGTREQAFAAAALVANREHEHGGKVLTNRDKEKSLKMLAELYGRSGIPKKEWPTNRQLAPLVPCSHTFVNSVDPFGRKNGDTRQEKKERKKSAASQNGQAPPPGGPLTPPPGAEEPPLAKRDPVNGMPATFEVVDKEGKPVAAYFEKSPAGALERYVLENHKAKKEDFTVQEIKKTEAPKAGTERQANVFDWASWDTHLGYVSRAVPVMGETYGRKKTAEFQEMEKILEKFCRLAADLRKEVTTKRK